MRSFVLVTVWCGVISSHPHAVFPCLVCTVNRDSAILHHKFSQSSHLLSLSILSSPHLTSPLSMCHATQFHVTAPDADEDDGYIVSFLNNWAAGESDFVVFDAKDIAKGAVMSLCLILRSISIVSVRDHQQLTPQVVIWVM